MPENEPIENEISPLAERIQIIRADSKLNLTQFAKRVNISHTTVSNIENGKTSPHPDTLVAIVNEFEVNPIWLNYGEGERYINNDKNIGVNKFTQKGQGNTSNLVGGNQTNSTSKDFSIELAEANARIRELEAILVGKEKEISTLERIIKILEAPKD